jgi:hypothetical protein
MDQDPGDPQSWNMYVYVRNNPLKYTDPTGRHHAECDHDDDYPDSIVVCVEEEIGPYYRHHPWSSGFAQPLVDRGGRGATGGGSSAQGGGGAAPNQGVPFLKEVSDARRTAIGKLDNPSMSCDALMRDASLAPSDVSAMVRRVSPVNGPAARHRISDLVNPAYASIRGATGLTVADTFTGGWPDQPGYTAHAWSPDPLGPAGYRIYLRPGWVTPELYIHEALHKFPNRDDAFFTTLPLWASYYPGGAGTGWISTAIAGECL